MFNLKKIIIFLLSLSLLSSCRIGDFADIGNHNYGGLYLYTLTASELKIYQIDTESGTLSDKGSMSISAANNSCKFVYENEKNNLFISHETANPAKISGYNINDDGSLDILPGYPVEFPGAASVDDFIFSGDKRFLYALTSDNLIYGFNYNSNGSISPTAQGILNDYTPPAEGFFNFDGHLIKNDSNGWTSYSIAGDGTIANYANGYNLGAGTGEYPAVANGYIFKLLLGAAGSNLGNSYNLDVHGIPVNTAASKITDNVTIGAVGGSNTNNALVKDPAQRYLYFVSINENNIYCIQTNTDGTMVPTDYIATGELPNAAAIDPNREFFFTASEDGVGGFQLNIHRMNGDLPSDTYDHTAVSEQILELIAVRR